MIQLMEAPPNQPINITPMSAEEAREYIEEINGSIESLALKLLELYRRRGWEALGYESWEECAKVEFRKSRAYLFVATCNHKSSNLQSSHFKTRINCNYKNAQTRINCN